MVGEIEGRGRGGRWGGQRTVFEGEKEKEEEK